MKLSEIRENKAGVFLKDTKNYFKIKGKRFVVIDRFSEDRSSGGTIVVLENGQRLEFLWDYDNPEIKLIGTGEIKTVVKITEILQ